MNDFEIHKLFSPFSFEEIFKEVGLRFRGVENLEKDDLLGKISGIGFIGGQEYRIEFKKFHDLRYGNVLPSMLESHVSSFLERDHRYNLPVFLISRVKKLSDSFLDNALHFFERYEGRDFNWLMVDDQGRLVGHFEDQIIDQVIRAKSPNKIQARKQESKQKLSFSPIQQWLLKFLLLNDLKQKTWPYEPNRKIHDYKVLAKASGVSASSCFNFIKLLQEHEYLFIDKYNYRFMNLRRLFDMWEAHYLSARKDEVYLSPIKPVESIGSWREKSVRLFHHVGLKLKDDFKVVMSGHMACQEVGLAWSNNQSVIFHATSSSNEFLEQFLKMMKLRPSERSEDGIRLILHKNDYPVLKLSEEHRKMNVADPIQLLLDVLFLGGRGKEQAEYIYEKVLENHFRKNQWMS